MATPAYTRFSTTFVEPGGLVHMLELTRRGEDLTEEQLALAAWCADQGVPFACFDDLRDAIAIPTDWGALQFLDSSSGERIVNRGIAWPSR